MGIQDLSFSEIIEALNHYRQRCVEKETECVALRSALESIRIWCEGSTCEICGEKKMVDTDCYEYVKKALKFKVR